jgi:hypothetical protein
VTTTVVTPAPIGSTRSNLHNTLQNQINSNFNQNLLTLSTNVMASSSSSSSVGGGVAGGLTTSSPTPIGTSTNSFLTNKSSNAQQQLQRSSSTTASSQQQQQQQINSTQSAVQNQKYTSIFSDPSDLLAATNHFEFVNNSTNSYSLDKDNDVINSIQMQRNNQSNQSNSLHHSHHTSKCFQNSVSTHLT